MKKLFPYFLLTAILVCLLTGSAAAAENAVSGNCYNSSTLVWTLDDEGTLTISGNGVLTGPAYPEDFPWYDYVDSIKTVVVSPGVTEIGKYGLRYLSSVTEVGLPDTVTALGASAFGECSQLTTINLPPDLTSIGGAAFAMCEQLQTLELPAGLTEIGQGAFEYCMQLQEITVPAGVTDIGNYTFQGCCSLQQVTLPEGLQAIGRSAFDGCEALSEIAIPESVTTIGASAFDSCSALQTLSIPAKITELDTKTFYECSSLTEVILPEGLTTIGKQAFYRCNSMVTLALPESLRAIGEQCFYDCASLTYLTLPANVESVGGRAFYSCDALDVIVINGTNTTFDSTSFDRCDENLILWAPAGSAAETFALEGGYSFYPFGEGESRFTAVGSDGLTWSISDSNVITISGSGPMTDYAEDTLPPWIPFADMITAVVIEDGVTHVGSQAFMAHDRITSLTLGDSVSTIGSEAFSGCTALTRLELNDALQSIDTAAFSGCTALEKAVLGNHLTAIGAQAFSGCSNLQTVTLGDNLQTIGTHAFADCPLLDTISISPPNPHYNVVENVLYSEDGATLVWYPAGRTDKIFTIPSAVNTIADDAFYQCVNLQDVSIPDTVTAIGKRAFYDCFGMKALRVPFTVTSYGFDAFYNCALETRTYPQSKPIASDNLADNNYIAYGWNHPIYSNLVANSDGSLTRVEAISSSVPGVDGKENVLIERYTRENGVLTWESGFVIRRELPYFGGYYSTDEYNFLIFGQLNLEESDEVEVIRVVKYSKDWSTRLDCAQLYGANTYVPFDAGSLRCADYNGYLYLRTSHEMYMTNDGLHHQANQTINIDISTMEIVHHYSEIMNPNQGYVSHSFNQFISTEDGVLVALDHGDAAPRAAVICQYRAPAGQPNFTPGLNKSCDYLEVFPFAGEHGANWTGAALGGFEVSDSSYLVAGSSVKQDQNYTDYTSQNIFVSIKSRADFTTSNAFKLRWFTDYTEGSNLSASNPHLVEITQNKYLLLWSERVVAKAGYIQSNGAFHPPQYTNTNRCFYTYIDGQGNQLGEVYSFTGGLSDCAPVVTDGTVTWYTTENDLPVFYTLSGDTLLRTDTNTGVRTLTTFAPVTLVSAQYRQNNRLFSTRLTNLSVGQSITLSPSEAAVSKLFLLDPNTLAPLSAPIQ